MTNWTEATRVPDVETIRLILLLAFEMYEASGRVPTALEIVAALKRPGV